MNKLTKFLLLGVGAPALCFGVPMAASAGPVSLAQPVVSSPSLTENVAYCWPRHHRYHRRYVIIREVPVVVAAPVVAAPVVATGYPYAPAYGAGVGYGAATASADVLGGLLNFGGLFGGSSWDGYGYGYGRGWDGYRHW